MIDVMDPEDWHKRKGTLQVGNILKRKRKDTPSVRYEWAMVRDVIRAAPGADKTEYVAVLCEGMNEHNGQWFVWRLYFTPNRYGERAYGQFAPQAQMAV